MSELDQISVIMAVYARDNHKHFDQALNSIWFEQTVKPSEIILIQDGILPESLLALIDKWSSLLNDVLVVRKNSVNQGLTKSLNIAIKLAKFNFIARMDADDISTSTRFEEQMNYLKDNPKIDVVGCSSQEFNQNGILPLVRTFPQNNSDILSMIHKSSPMCHGAVMFRRRIFDTGNFYNESYRTSQDIALWFDLMKKGYQFANVNKVLYFVRLNEEFHKRRSFGKGWKEFLIYEKGIISLSGYSFKLIYPFMRLFFRMLPGSLIRRVYFSRVREMLNR